MSLNFVDENLEIWDGFLDVLVKTSLQASKLRQSERPSDRVTGVEFRATNVAKK